MGGLPNCGLRNGIRLAQVIEAKIDSDILGVFETDCRGDDIANFYTGIRTQVGSSGIVFLGRRQGIGQGLEGW